MKTLQVISHFPAPIRRLMKALFTMLSDVAAHSGTNLMGPSNLAVVFGPNLLPASAKMTQITTTNQIVEKMIVCSEFLFGPEFDKTFVPK